jgi:hypothetical protein
MFIEPLASHLGLESDQPSEVTRVLVRQQARTLALRNACVQANPEPLLVCLGPMSNLCLRRPPHRA